MPLHGSDVDHSGGRYLAVQLPGEFKVGASLVHLLYCMSLGFGRGICPDIVDVSAGRELGGLSEGRGGGKRTKRLICCNSRKLLMRKQLSVV